MRRILLTLLAVVALAGCGEGGGAAAPAPERTAANGEVHNDADVAFATQMVPHHADALVMVDLTTGRDVSPALAALAEDVREAQAPEIEVMVDWLDGWGEPIPATSRDHVNSHGHGEEGDDGDLRELEAATGERFEELWLESMIAHHEGAVEMAAAHQAEGLFPEAVALAEQIEASQRAEVDRMERLLAR